MIFQRREKLSLWARLRDFVRPRKGWKRGFRYIGKRVQRLPDTPHRIALGFACGALASFTPFFTLHALVAALLAWISRGNLIAAVFGTIVGNPITFPLIAATSLQFGNWMMGRIANIDAANEKMTFAYVTDHPFDFLESIFVPYLVGGFLPGVLCALACYLLIRPAVATFQRRRRTILSERAETLVAERRSRIEAELANVTGEGRSAGVVPFPKRAGARIADPAEPDDREPRTDQPQNDNSKSRAL